MALDLTLAPLYRINGQEIASLPGLLALMPPLQRGAHPHAGQAFGVSAS
jgi:hypothetical protein